MVGKDGRGREEGGGYIRVERGEEAEKEGNESWIWAADFGVKRDGAARNKWTNRDLWRADCCTRLFLARMTTAYVISHDLYA